MPRIAPTAAMLLFTFGCASPRTTPAAPLPSTEAHEPSTPATNVPSMPPPGAQASEPSRVPYDKDAVEVVLHRASRQVKANCGQAKDQLGKASGPWGKATITVMLGRNGHSKGVSVPSPFSGKPTGNCVERAFTNLVYPPWAGADAEVSWDVDIVAPDASSAK